MPVIRSQKIRLSSRPTGTHTAANFALTVTELLVCNLFMFVDLSMRGCMNQGRSYVPSFEVDKLIEGENVGDVIESLSKELKVGDVITSRFDWRKYFIAKPAWVGLKLVGVKVGDVIFNSGVAGTVENVAGQSAKPRGYNVVGSAVSVK